MDTSANIITTMGIIANEVYASNKQTYFEDLYENGEKIEQSLEANGTTYKVIDHTPADNEGFNALLLKDESTGEYVIAFRGTQETFDIVEDGIIGLNNYSSQFEKAKVWVNQMIENNNIDKSKLTLTGHSLGGILTQAIGTTYQIKGYAFNGYGVDRLLTMPSLPINTSLALDLIYGIIHTAIYKIFSAFGMEAPNAQWAQENILNVQYFDNGLINGDPLSNLATNLTSKHLGDFLPIFGTEKSIGEGHRMPVLNDAIEHYNNILNSFSSDTSFMDLTDIYTICGFDKVEKIFTELQIQNAPKNSLELLMLTTKTQTQLQDKTLANLYALENLNPFVIEGDFEVYNNIDVSKYTDQYLEDRATYLYYLLDKENRYDIDPALSMTAYEDVELGSEYTLEQSFSRSKIVFGGDSDNTLIGGDGSDRLYAGLGNDTIEAGTGINYIDGGEGNDTVSYKTLQSKEGITLNLSLTTAQTINSTII